MPQLYALPVFTSTDVTVGAQAESSRCVLGVEEQINCFPRYYPRYKAGPECALLSAAIKPVSLYQNFPTHGVYNVV
jgi:hypothetical protein